MRALAPLAYAAIVPLVVPPYAVPGERQTWVFVLDSAGVPVKQQRSFGASIASLASADVITAAFPDLARTQFRNVGRWIGWIDVGTRGRVSVDAVWATIIR
jgi:hypothetical protein